MKRNFGIDLAKCLSMFMVVVLHNLLVGGVLDTQTINITNLSYWLLENYAIVAVNIFAMVTGFLMFDRTIKLQKLFKLWRIVLFWSIIPAIVIMLVTKNWNLKMLIKACLPFVTGEYWYFNAYVLMFLFIPCLNAGIRSLKQIDFERLLVLILILSATVGLLENLFLLGGHSTTWLIVMYFCGAYLKVTRRDFDRLKSWILMLVFCLMGVFSLLGEVFCMIYAKQYVLSWTNYNAPFVVIQTFSLFILLSRIHVTKPMTKKVLELITPLTFSVYLLDTNIAFYNIVLPRTFSFLKNQHALIGYGIILISSMLLFAIFVLLEFSRVRLLRKIKTVSWYNTVKANLFTKKI